ncbi:MAG TPA: antitoxin [Gammaproteobacteria bacterium]|nr:antitoxin [Gammaproteobacteria bacterium]
MRTTLNIDPDVLHAAKQIAAARAKGVGEVLSELARRGLEAQAKLASRDGFPVFEIPAGAKPLTLEDIRRDEDDE